MADEQSGCDIRHQIRHHIFQNVRTTTQIQICRFRLGPSTTLDVHNCFYYPYCVSLFQRISDQTLYPRRAVLTLRVSPRIGRPTPKLGSYCEIFSYAYPIQHHQVNLQILTKFNAVDMAAVQERVHSGPLAHKRIFSRPMVRLPTNSLLAISPSWAPLENKPQDKDCPFTERYATSFLFSSPASTTNNFCINSKMRQGRMASNDGSFAIFPLQALQDLERCAGSHSGVPRPPVIIYGLPSTLFTA